MLQQYWALVVLHMQCDIFRANIQGGIEIGFHAATASLIAAQTVKGAAELLLQRGTHP